MNKLLERQIRKCLGRDAAISETLQQLIDAVSESYDHYENDRKMLERSMEISSEELENAYSQLKQEAESQRQLLQKLQGSLERLSADGETLPQKNEPANTGKTNPNAATNLSEVADRLNAEISRRQQMERDIKTNRANLSALIENSDNAIWSLDVEGRLLICNSACRAFLQPRYRGEMNEGEPFLDRLLPDQREQWQTWFDQAAGGVRFTALAKYEADADTAFYEISFNPIVDDGQIQGVSVFAANVTERKANEESILRANHQLTQTLEELRATQEHLIQSEKNAGVGQLVAGVAHEINTPIGAIKASYDNMHEHLNLFVSRAPEFIRLLSDGEVAQLQALLSVTLYANVHNSLTTREERQYRKNIIKILEANDIADPDDVARKLVATGIVDCIEDYILLFKHSRADFIVDMIYQMGQLKINLDNIGVAVNKTKRTVFALKSFVNNKDSNDKPVVVTLKDSLEIVLTLYMNQMKYGVDLTVEFDPSVKVFGVADDLTQVWSNIVHNAIQAMNFQGALDVKIYREGAEAVVAITDSGPGIPPENLNKIFAAFYTTKGSGEGSGLGLSICRDVAQKHGGRIEVTSAPGCTCFSIRMPIYTEETVSTTEVGEKWASNRPLKTAN